MPTPAERIKAAEVAIWDPHYGKRIGAAWDAMVKEMWDDEWHPWLEVIATGVEAGQVMSQSAASLIYKAVALGLLEKQGKYKLSSKSDTRQLRIASGAYKMRPDLFGLG